MHCPSCQGDVLRAWEGHITRSGIQIVACGRRCSACGETLYDHEEIGHQERELSAALIRRGLRSGAEFAFVRKVAGFQVAEIASLLGVRSEVLCRWERGEVDVPRTAALELARYASQVDAAKPGNAGPRE
jgi:DNA-binding transcriptional regulator YiaG